MTLQPMLIKVRGSHLSSLMLLANIDREEDFSVSPVLRRRWLVVHHERQAGRWVASWREIIFLLSLIYWNQDRHACLPDTDEGKLVTLGSASEGEPLANLN